VLQTRTAIKTDPWLNMSRPCRAIAVKVNIVLGGTNGIILTSLTK